MFWKEKRKKYIIRITMYDEREAHLVAGLENDYSEIILRAAKDHMQNNNGYFDHISIMLMEHMTKWEAMKKCMKYSKMGIDTCALKNR